MEDLESMIKMRNKLRSIVLAIKKRSNSSHFSKLKDYECNKDKRHRINKFLSEYTIVHEINKFEEEDKIRMAIKPKSWNQIKTDDSWHIFKVISEFVEGFEKLARIGPCVSIFGSARTNPSDKYYRLAEEIAYLLTKHGFGIITGGGPGIMEAANKGAHFSGGKSVGLNINLPFEQMANPFIDSDKLIDFNYFFVRKVLLLKYSYAFIVMPGGMGTMDELFETLTLIQTGIIHNFPIVLIGLEFFARLQRYLDFMVEEGTISKSDLDLVIITDNIDEALAHISKYIQSNYKLYERHSPLWWLFERQVQ